MAFLYVCKNTMSEAFIALYPNETDAGGRYICVTGNSLGAIAEAAWNNVFH